MKSHFVISRWGTRRGTHRFEVTNCDLEARGPSVERAPYTLQTAMNEKIPGVDSDPEILGGAAVFVGTRVPVRALFDYLERGRPLGEFLDDFPTVTREQAAGVLEHMKRLAINAPASR